MMSTHQILCAGCGLLISPNESNLCLNCIKASVDITHGIPKQSTVQFCKGCDRYLAPPYQWTTCSLESRELLALLLRKLNLKQRLIDACFLWTEPHSKRLKVKLTIQQPVLNVVLEQVFVVEFVVCNQYCADCTRVDSQLTWKAVVQCRQKVEHKRTFIWLEQLILKHNAHKETCNILEFKDGLDFYFASRNHAIKMVEFLNKMVPIKSKSSQELISADIHAGTADFKFTYSVQLAPVCKDDLVCLPLKVSRKLGTMSQLALCSRVSNMLVFIDPLTGKYSELRAAQYWDQQFSPLAELKELVEFYVMDVEIQHTVGKYAIAIATCCRSQDFSITYQVRTHLGHILKPGDHAKGYLVCNSNYNNDDYVLFQQKQKNQLPDVVLVKKSYPQRRKTTKPRSWKLHGLTMDQGDRTNGNNNKERDLEVFLQDIEEDAELRGMVNLYKKEAPVSKHADASGDADMDMAADSDEAEEDFPEINVDDLLDDIELMTISQPEEPQEE